MSKRAGTSARQRRMLMVGARLVVDAMTVTIALGLATVIRLGRTAEGQGVYGRYLLAFVLLWLVSIGLAGGYSRYATDEPNEEFRAVLTGSALGVALMVTGSFVVDFDLSRIWTALALVLGTTLSAIGRAMLLIAHRLRSHRGILKNRILIVGVDRSAFELAKDAVRAGIGTNKVIGFVAHRERDVLHPARRAGDQPNVDVEDVVGTVDDLPLLIEKYNVNEVLVAPSVAVGRGFEEVVHALDGIPVELRAAPGILGFLPSRIEVHPLGDRPMLHLERPELRLWAKLVKRTIDLALAIPLLILFTPFIAAAALAIKIDSRGPVFFRQARAGQGGTIFRCWKLRTMVPDAEDRRDEIVELTNGDPLKIHEIGDPRITRIGRFLRRTSIDELPQLLNVIVGQMSLVGPRPHALVEVEDYTEAQRRRLHVKPGMTGMWQVNGRHEHDVEDYITQDILYVQNWSVAMDLALLFRTIPAVLTMKGAK